MEKEVYDMMKNEQNIHWWFAGKKKIVMELFKKYFWEEWKKDKKILDIGCGMGGMLERLAEYGDVYGCDIEESAVEYCRKNWGEKVQQGNFPVEQLYEADSFDAVIMLDVLEHIQNDEDALDAIYKLLKSNGKVLLTVPAQMKQWSYNDEVVHHYRRYEYKELRNKLRAAGFRIQKVSFYNFILYPFIFIIRNVKRILKIKKPDISVEMKDNVINRILRIIFGMEAKWLLRKDFSYGVSLVAVAKK